MKAGKKEESRKSYFQSRIFKRLFFSYTLIILIIFGALIGWSLVAYRREASALKERQWEQRADSWGNWMDQQLMQAQNLCASVNASESARAILQTAYVEKKTINALQLYNMLGELTRIKGAARNMGIYSLMLAFQGKETAGCRKLCRGSV